MFSNFTNFFNKVALVSVAFIHILAEYNAEALSNLTIGIKYTINENDFYFGYSLTSFCFVYLGFNLFNWSAPSVLNISRDKSRWVDSFRYIFFVAPILLKVSWLIYVQSLILALSAAILWRSQGNQLILENVRNERNFNWFWLITQLCMLFGNLYIFVIFSSHSFNKYITQLLFVILLLKCYLGPSLLLLLGPPIIPEITNTSLQNFLRFFSKETFLLLTTFIFTGMEYFFGAYSDYGPEKLCTGRGLTWISISALFIILGHFVVAAFIRMNSKSFRFHQYAILVGFYSHVLSTVIILCLAPHENYERVENSMAVALFCSFLFGFGDACYNPMINERLGFVFADPCMEAYALTKFVQISIVGIVFSYASIGMVKTVAVLLIFFVAGYIGYHKEDKGYRFSTIFGGGDQSRQNITCKCIHPNSYLDLCRCCPHSNVIHNNFR